MSFKKLVSVASSSKRSKPAVVDTELAVRSIMGSINGLVLGAIQVTNREARIGIPVTIPPEASPMVAAGDTQTSTDNFAASRPGSSVGISPDGPLFVLGRSAVPDVAHYRSSDSFALAMLGYFNVLTFTTVAVMAGHHHGASNRSVQQPGKLIGAIR